MAIEWKKFQYNDPRITSVASSATPTPNVDTTDLYIITALAEAATFGVPAGTPKDGQKLLIRIKDNGTARALSWNAIYAGDNLPVTTVISTIMYLACIYNSAASKWDSAYAIHAASHTDGTDDIQSATNAQKGLATAAQITKLDGIEALADVTDAVNIASSIVGVVDKATPVDADSIGLIDSAATNVLKELTWANIKATLKTYMDTLYNKYIHPNHSGDVTSVADGAQTIVAKAVTYAKMQDVSATDKVLGRATAGAGVVEEIACTAAGRALIDDADAAAQRATLSAAKSGVNTDITSITAKIEQTNAIENESKLLQTEDIFSDFVVTGLLPATSVNLISDISAGHAYVTGTRVNKAITSKTYTASKDTYVDVNSTGTYTFVEVVLDAAAPAVTADSIRLAKVVTDVDNITGVTDLRLLVPATVHSSVDVVTHNAITATAAQAGHATATQITKLDGIETAAKDDQTDNEIITLIDNMTIGTGETRTISSGIQKTTITANDAILTIDGTLEVSGGFLFMDLG